MSDDLNARSRAAWETIAPFWDDHIGPGGNEWHRQLIAPAQMELLEIEPGQRVLEVACGNGQFAREMAASGAAVTATDFSEPFLELARGHTPDTLPITYSTLDVADEAALRAICAEPFDAVVATMALMDIADIEPLARVMPSALKPGGRFVFSVMHPCFNSADISMVAEEDWPEGQLRVEHVIKVRRYLDYPPHLGIGIEGQPEPHIYFHRPLHELFGTFTEQGLVMDGLREPAFPANPTARPLTWAAFPQIPPALVARFRRLP